MKTLTNILNYEINKEAIERDFYVVKFENEKDFKKINSRFLDIPDVNVIALSYSSGKNAYALMDKEAYEDLRYSDELENIKYSIMNISNVYDDMLIKLFINALSNYNQELAYNNLTGRFYKFLNNSGSKIKALDFNVIKYNENVILKVSTTSFKMVKKLSYGEPCYVLTGNNKSLKRTFNVNEGCIYVKGNEKNKKTSCQFLDIRTGDGRVKEIMSLIDIFNKKFSMYISISLREYQITNKINPRKTKLQEETLPLIMKYKINVVNLITDAAYEDEIIDFENALKSLKLKTTMSSKMKRDSLNIALIYDKDYYEENNVEDPHETLDTKFVHQCIIIEHLKDMFNFDKGSLKPSAQLITIFKELLIKNDIINHVNSFSYDDWLQYKYNDVYTFIIKNNDDSIYKMVIEPSGKYDIFKEEIDLFNSYENNKYITIFRNNKNVQLIVIDDKNNINAIERTEIITLPFAEIFSKLPISKSRKTRDELYAGLCDINYFEIDKEYYYNVGQSLATIQKQISKASHFYNVICVDNSKCIMPNILELMSVRFVKFNESTVLPYPVKYLREYININKK